MKTALRFLLALTIAAGLLAVTGCKSVSTSSTQLIGGPVYPPSNPVKIQILRAEPPRPHVRLGNVQAEPSSDSVGAGQIEDALRKEAAKLGADAVVIVYDHTQIMGAIVTGPMWGRSVERIEGRVIVGIAIKYQ